MNILRKLVITLLLVVVISQASMAQYDSTHEFSLWGTVGNSSMRFSGPKAKSSSQFTGTMGVGYTYYYHPQWGLSTGVEFAPMSSEVKFHQIHDEYTVANAGWDKKHVYEMEFLKEKVNLTQVNIPIMVQYNSKTYLHGFFAAAGIKIGLPITKTSKVRASEFTETISKLSVTDTRDGKTNLGREGFKQNVNFKTAIMASVDIGFKWALSYSVSLYTGGYFDYTMNNIGKPKTRNLIERSYSKNPEDQPFIHNSALNSKFVDDTGQPYYYVGKVQPMSFGMKIRVSFQIGGNGNYNKDKKKKYIKGYYMSKDFLDGMYYNEDQETIRKKIEEKDEQTMKVEMKQLIDKYNKKQEKYEK